MVGGLRGRVRTARDAAKLVRFAGVGEFVRLVRARTLPATGALSPEEDAESGDPFADVWEPETKALGLSLLRDLYEHLERAGVEPVMFYGTLLGACRTGGLIPWDGDFDLVVDLRNRRRVQRALASLPPEYAVVPHRTYNYKVFPVEGDPTHHFRWPWVDVDFLEVSSRLVRVLDVDGSTFYECEVEDFFPYARRPFEDMELATPHQPEWHLDRLYPGWETVHRSSSVDHRSARTRETIVERRADAVTAPEEDR